jgi:predicted  nucleic acid-binding Zn-ribbon protein
LEQLNFLEEQVALLLGKYQGMSEENRELKESLVSQQDKVRQLEEILKGRDALLAEVENRIDRLLRKFSDFDSPVPDPPLLSVDEPN